MAAMRVSWLPVGMTWCVLLLVATAGSVLRGRQLLKTDCVAFFSSRTRCVIPCQPVSAGSGFSDRLGDLVAGLAGIQRTVSECQRSPRPVSAPKVRRFPGSPGQARACTPERR